MTTEWKKRLRQRAAAISRAEEARRKDIAAARLDGHHFRELGTWAGVNHERARQICIDINGDSRTQAERDAEQQPADA
jgi:hypothetical protein